MTGSEVASPAFLILFDFHIRITECDTFDSVAILDINDRLLLAVAWLAFANATRFVECDFTTFVRCQLSLPLQHSRLNNKAIYLSHI